MKRFNRLPAPWWGLFVALSIVASLEGSVWLTWFFTHNVIIALVVMFATFVLIAVQLCRWFWVKGASHDKPA
jgi:hypothetical protein